MHEDLIRTTAYRILSTTLEIDSVKSELRAFLTSIVFQDRTTLASNLNGMAARFDIAADEMRKMTEYTSTITAGSAKVIAIHLRSLALQLINAGTDDVLLKMTEDAAVTAMQEAFQEEATPRRLREEKEQHLTRGLALLLVDVHGLNAVEHQALTKKISRYMKGALEAADGDWFERA